ncbi:MAG TPA: DUF4190 domain-containing protein [Prosthecobacter sp.]|nr:DUF4190 domain-containing protein [Prosthecobacter sp.]
MSASPDSEFYLRWRGQQIGPWRWPHVRAALDSGEIHSLYQIQIAGEWQPLRDYLEHVEAQQAEAAGAARLRQDYEQRIAAEKAESAKLRRQLQTQPAPAQPPARPPNPPPYAKGASMPVPPPPPPPSGSSPMSPMPAATYYQPVRTSGLAVASFVLSLCFLVPFVNLVNWIPGLVFGHIALVQFKKDPRLDGRGLAIAGVIVSYIWLVGLISLTFYFVSRRTTF